jgi:hypothetical protein
MEDCIKMKGYEVGIWLGQAAESLVKAGFVISDEGTSGPATRLINFLSKCTDSNFIVANFDAMSKPI